MADLTYYSVQVYLDPTFQPVVKQMKTNTLVQYDVVDFPSKLSGDQINHVKGMFPSHDGRQEL